ncbi:MAG: hypothetical protein AKCLJLPJ_00430 [Fimbriimonadales bacterium]|nr:hypothetical protein [Fimbriimonadales bacterium]
MELSNGLVRVTLSGERPRIESLVIEGEGGGQELLSPGGVDLFPYPGPIQVAEVGSSERDVVVAAFDWEAGLTYQAFMGLVPEVAAVDLAVCVFNRGPSFKRVAPRVTIRPGTGRLSAAAEVDGVSVIAAPDDNALLVHRPCPGGEIVLGPFRTDSFRLRLTASPGGDGLRVTGAGTSALLGDRLLRVASDRSRRVRLVVLLAGGDTADTEVDVTAGELSEVPLDSLPSAVTAFEIRDESGRTLVCHPQPEIPALAGPVGPEDDPLPDLFSLLAEGRVDEAEVGLHFATTLSGVSHGAWLGLGLVWMQRGDVRRAAQHLEESLLYGADNPIAWWLKHWCLREADEVADQDLPNAHFLSPLEPVLRAEAFFGAGSPEMAMSLLSRLGGDPGPYREVAHWLALGGQHRHRFRWLEAAKDQTQDGLFDLLVASALQRAQMGATAYERLDGAVRSETISPPFYPTEFAEIAGLRERFADHSVWERLRASGGAGIR